MAFCIVLFVFWFCYGAICGSFVKLCADRFPQGASVIKGRSKCDYCGERLSWHELIPIFSWLAQRGKCRRCGAKLGASYPIAEAVCGLLFCAALYKSGLAPYTIAHSLFLAGLAAAALIDAKSKKVPNALNITLAAFGLLGIMCEWGELPASIPSHLLGAVAVPAFMCAVALMTKGFGGGDIKLLAAVGLLLGLKGSVICAAAAFVLGGVYAAYLLIFKKAGRKTRIAFAPFISIAAIITSFMV